MHEQFSATACRDNAATSPCIPAPGREGELGERCGRLKHKSPESLSAADLYSAAGRIVRTFARCQTACRLRSHFNSSSSLAIGLAGE